MATKEFKEMAMEAAVATGDLTKSFDAAGNAIYKTSKGTEVTAANFSSTLSDAWFSSEALIGVLNNYGGYADGVYELYNNLADGVDKTTSEIIQDLKNLKGADDQTILNAGYTKDQIDLVRQLSEEVGGVGQKSFAAAQEAKTFSEVLDSVKEAVGSGWAQTFETVFGNYEEAKVLWTDLANELYDVFAESGNARNELLSEALSVSGFDRFTATVREAGIEMDVFEEKLGEVASNKGLSLEDIISEYGSLEKAVQNGAISADMLSEAVDQCAEGFSALDLSRLHDSLNDVIDGIDELTGREHGQTLRAVLEDDPEYFYEGRFTVNSWKSPKDWSRIVIDYNVGPYKWSVLSSIDDWLWDPFNFQNGVIRPMLFKNINVTTATLTRRLDAALFGRAPVCPRFVVSTTAGRGIHIRFVNPQLDLDVTKLLPEGTSQIPEFVFFGDQGATIYLWCDSGTGTVSVDFRQGRL